MTLQACPFALEALYVMLPTRPINCMVVAGNMDMSSAPSVPAAVMAARLTCIYCTSALTGAPAMCCSHTFTGSMQRSAHTHFRDGLQKAVESSMLVYNELATEGFVMHHNRQVSCASPTCIICMRANCLVCFIACDVCHHCCCCCCISMLHLISLHPSSTF